MENIGNIRLESDVKDSQYVRISRLHYTQNGQDMSWDIAERRDSVAVLVYDRDDDCFVMVRQFRPAVYLRTLRDRNPELFHSADSSAMLRIQETNVDGLGFTLELCAGLVDKEGRSNEQIAVEEIEEECGYKLPSVESLEHVANYYLSTASSSPRQWLYYAVVDRSMRLHNEKYAGAAEEMEMVEIVRVPVDKAHSVIFNGEDASMPTTLYALNWWFTNKAGSDRRKLV